MTAGNDVDTILDQIRERGGRVSPVTRHIVEMVVDDPHAHIRSTEFIQRVNETEPVIESTVYRTLDRLVAHGILERLQLGSGPPSYHLSPHHHEHLVCEHCGNIIDVPAHLLDSLAHRLRTDHGFTLRIGSSSLNGICEDCRSTNVDPR